MRWNLEGWEFQFLLIHLLTFFKRRTCSNTFYSCALGRFQFFGPYYPRSCRSKPPHTCSGGEGIQKYAEATIKNIFAKTTWKDRKVMEFCHCGKVGTLIATTECTFVSYIVQSDSSLVMKVPHPSPCLKWDYSHYFHYPMLLNMVFLAENIHTSQTFKTQIYMYRVLYTNYRMYHSLSTKPSVDSCRLFKGDTKVGQVNILLLLT